MGTEPSKSFAKSYVDWVDRLRENLLKGIEWLVRFCELVLLAGALQFAATKTNNAFVYILAILLSGGAMVYVSEYWLWVTRDWSFERWGRWKWPITVVIFGLVGWAVYRAMGNVSEAIEASAKSSI